MTKIIGVIMSYQIKLGLNDLLTSTIISIISTLPSIVIFLLACLAEYPFFIHIQNKLKAKEISSVLQI